MVRTMSEAKITWISGPVLRAITEDDFHINEAVFVGDDRLLGEVIRIEQNTIVAQVYEDTSGLRPGDKVTGNAAPLSVKLGPAILGNIFDGLLRPLTAGTGEYVQPGMQAPPPASFEFKPVIRAGDYAAAGAIIGTANGANGRLQSVLVPPGISGMVKNVVEKGEYSDEQSVCSIKTDSGELREVAMCHQWSIRSGLWWSFCHAGGVWYRENCVTGNAGQMV